MLAAFAWLFGFVVLVCANDHAESEVRVENAMSASVRLDWMNAEHKPIFMADVEAGSVFSLRSFVGHLFRVSQGDRVLDDFTVLQAPHDRVTVLPSGRLQQKKTAAGSKAPLVADDSWQACEREHAWTSVVAHVCAPTPFEWTVLAAKMQAQRAAVQGRADNERRREYLNREQPRHAPKFTPVGFEKTLVPDALWQKISAFWQANRHKTVNENWDLGNSYVNHWEIAPSMCYMPESLKAHVFSALQPLLERWANQTELEPTACYGVRLYHRGSKLENHVDRLDTHAISAIINVDQLVQEEWPLEIYDHADNKHHVFLKPRDMVFYESARCIHGRPTPLNGTFFANFFVHFRPKHNWVTDAQVGL
jgi:hypothetical protein